MIERHFVLVYILISHIIKIVIKSFETNRYCQLWHSKPMRQNDIWDPMDSTYNQDKRQKLLQKYIIFQNYAGKYEHYLVHIKKFRT